VVGNILSGVEGADEAFDEQRRATVAAVREIAAQYRATFNTPQGRAVLQHLRSVTIEQSAWVPGYTLGCDGVSAEQQGFMREGQNSMVREIERYLAWEDPDV